MLQDKLPLFPLGVVLFPGAVLPLHIFEDRYKELIGEAIQNQSEFGIVFANERGLANVGCTAVVEEILKRYPDGRMDVLTRGRRRFEIMMIHEERNFLEGSVAGLTDEDIETPDASLKKKALEAWMKWIVLERGSLPAELPDLRRPELSFLLADAVPEVDFRQTILMLRSEKERLEAILDFLPDYVDKERVKRAVKRVAPLNGHSKHLKDETL